MVSWDCWLVLVIYNLLFRCLEASWEVANKQGGIYTVLRSKAAVSVREMGDR